MPSSSAFRYPRSPRRRRRASAEVLPGYGTLRNPLDITGAASENPQLFADALAAVAGRSGGGGARGGARPAGRGARGAVQAEARGDRGAACARPASAASSSRRRSGDIDDATASVLDEIGIPHAITRAPRRRRRRRQRDPLVGMATAAARTPEPAGDELELADRSGHWSEARGLELLAEHGIPVVPWRLARTPEEAVAAARELGYPVVVKVVSPEILHKSDIGGVALRIGDDDEVREAFERVTGRGRQRRGRTCRGSARRRDAERRHRADRRRSCATRSGARRSQSASAASGCTSLDDTSLRLLPVGEDDVREMLDELRGRALLDGVRGSTPGGRRPARRDDRQLRPARRAARPAAGLDRDQPASRRRRRRSRRSTPSSSGSDELRTTFTEPVGVEYPLGGFNRTRRGGDVAFSHRISLALRTALFCCLRRRRPLRNQSPGPVPTPGSTSGFWLEQPVLRGRSTSVGGRGLVTCAKPVDSNQRHQAESRRRCSRRARPYRACGSRPEIRPARRAPPQAARRS